MPLQLAVDDILVNFADNRARTAVTALQFARRRFDNRFRSFRACVFRISLQYSARVSLWRKQGEIK